MKRRAYVASLCGASGVLAGCTFGVPEEYDVRIENDDDSPHTVDAAASLAPSDTYEPVWEDRVELAPGGDEEYRDAFSLGVDGESAFEVVSTLDGEATYRARYTADVDVTAVRVLSGNEVAFPDADDVSTVE